MNRAERWTARVLLLGGLLGVALMVVGVVGSALKREHVASALVSVHEIVAALSHRPIEPVAIATLGIVALLATPLAAVATAGVAFALERDWRYVAVGALIVAELTLSVLVGGVG